MYKNIDGFLHTLNLVHKMDVDIIKLVYSSAELVHTIGGCGFISYYSPPHMVRNNNHNITYI